MSETDMQVVQHPSHQIVVVQCGSVDDMPVSAIDPASNRNFGKSVCYNAPATWEKPRRRLFDKVEMTMTSTAKRAKATPRRDRWHEIEGRHFGQCFWQEISPNRRLMLEGLMHKSTQQIWIVEKSFNDPIPRDGDRRPYPELGGVVVYRPVAPEVSDWDEFEKAIA